jgi:hypothetical protein
VLALKKKLLNFKTTSVIEAKDEISTTVQDAVCDAKDAASKTSLREKLIQLAEEINTIIKHI